MFCRQRPPALVCKVLPHSCDADYNMQLLFDTVPPVELCAHATCRCDTAALELLTFLPAVSEAQLRETCYPTT